MICLLPHCGYLSETSRMLEIHRALVARGAAVRVATHGGPHEAVLRAAGVAYDVVGPHMDADRSAAFVRAGVGLGSVRQSMYTDDELRAYARAEAVYFRAHAVRVAVTGFQLTAMLSTRLAGIPLVTEHAGSWVPPVFERGLVPVPTTPRLSRLRYLTPPVARRLVNAAPTRMRAYCAGFDRVAAQLGVPGVPSTAALMLGDLALVPEVPEVVGVPAAELHAWRPRGRAARPGTRLRSVGPLFARFDAPVPADVERVLAGPGPVVYVAITSSPAALVRQVVAGLATLDVRVVVAATVHDLADLASDRVAVGGVLPSARILPRVDLAVTAGGQGSLQTAMAAGTPVLAIPLQPEQDLNVALLARLGAARGLPLRRVGTPAFPALVAAMLADGRHGAAARRIAALYADVDGPGEAADAILALAASSPPAGSTTGTARGTGAAPGTGTTRGTGTAPGTEVAR